MCATLAKGKTFTSTEQVTAAKLHELIDSGSISGILNADCSASMALATSKIAFATAPAVLALPNGAGGTTVDASGEVCVDTTSRTVNFYDGTAEVVLNPVIGRGATIEDPSNTEDISLFYLDDAATITKVVAVLVGSATPSVTWTIRHGTDRSAAGAEVVTSGTATTNVTTGEVVTSFNDATIVADSFVWLETTAQSGTVDQINLTIFYRQDA